MNLRAANLRAITEDEFQAWQEEQLQRVQEAQEGDQEALERITRSKISGDAMQARGLAKGSKKGEIESRPGDNGNDFDISMAAEPDSALAACRAVQVLEQRGVCIVEANAPYDVLMSAFQEGEHLWQSGGFQPPMEGMQATRLEEELWTRALYQDEERAMWINEALVATGQADGLSILAQSCHNFARTLQQELCRTLGITWTGIWDAMLTCYTGDRSYAFHLDNPHARSDAGLPDNGVRLTMCYFINPHWNPTSGDNGGGLDLFLTEPSQPLASASDAWQSSRLRVAPHADTLVVFLSQRMAHQVIETKGDEIWLCLWMWCVDEQAVCDYPAKMLERQGADKSVP